MKTLRQAFKLTREEFRAQFKYEITCNPSSLVFNETRYGYKVYRLLEKLVLQDDAGRLFASSLPITNN